MRFQKKLEKAIKKNGSLLCVGLDSDLKKLPPFIRKKKYPLFEFNKRIIETTYDLVCAYKMNSAFYEALGADGIKQLKMTFDLLIKDHPGLPLILDAKRGDIGNTNEGYIEFVYKYLGADAVTLHPYLGREALSPFLEIKDKGAIILCKTSNFGGGEFQDLMVKEPLFKIVAKRVAEIWNTNNNCMLVVGATYPEQLKEIRRLVGDMTILVPGIGAQGGDLEKTLKAGLNYSKKGLIINSSRGIIYAGKDNNFAQKAREEALKLREEINKYR